MSKTGYRVDLHVKVLDDEVVSRAKAHDLDGIVYAPHFVRLPEIRERSQRFSDDELLIVPGREIFTGSWRNRKHVLVVDPDAPIPDFISLDGAMKHLTDRDETVLVPHPAFMTVSLTEPDITRYRDALHGIEVFNTKHFPWHNRRAREIQESVGVPAFTSSYAHLKGTIGEAWTTFPALDPTNDGLVTALRAGDDRRIEHRSGPLHRVRLAAEFAHLFYENSVVKARGLYRGPKATNPFDPVYEGRFDDIAVYPASLSTRTYP